ncbi:MULTISPECIES: response regulator transcription factor [Xanthobacter]|uniref:DNA-binding NarL/FixJ family response regulator n=1 Tax=Xanthobacter flavus TaxID=281 RepID=A0A9W6CKJ0_XANFL|nr:MULTISPECIES: response regulator transcription factor [Xanthobacter]MBN8918589.1 response regulator transcription factor [Hyphomicrobiales bacterium]MDR6335343.1 DNA-binding NarL/FixJ family response regulator [Xanthobacter flavus]UDQ87977.1 response regulator transcription factor [Xanthobacter autotrophicus]UJX46049.1 DNA-binding response regulator [Xanthobacter sp. YC-JY1]GLI24103.1 DNA-binding response regulator [Xanthobacter flavus]
MTSVLLIDDHPIVLQGCRHLLEDAGVSDLMEAQTALAGYRLFRRKRPDVVIVDLALNGSGLAGLALVRRLRAQAARMPILVFSMHADPVIASRALEAGATGYLLKDTSPDDLLEAFEKVRRGQPYISHDLALEVALLGTRGRSGVMADLTPRELQALALLAEGKAYGQIADELGVSYKTVANTCSQLKAKLGATNLAELIHRAIQYVAGAPAGRMKN